MIHREFNGPLIGRLAAIAATAMLAGCAHTETLVAPPEVRLTSVELEKASFDRQTFLLGFDVGNPNPFPLPISSIRYRISLDETRFAGGETAAEFTVPAGGENRFLLSVELDLLNTANQLGFLLRGGLPEHVDYRLDGSLTVDIPFARPLAFSSTGTIGVNQ